MTRSSSSATPISMQEATSTRTGRSSNRTSLAARSAVQCGTTRSSSSLTIREREQPKAYPLAISRCRPSLNGADNSTTLTGSVGGPYFASLLTQELGYAVTSGEPYCRASFSMERSHRARGQRRGNLLQYIPSPNVSVSQFSTSAFAQTVRDDKGSVRIDANTRFGQVSGYYFVDDYDLDNPYPARLLGRAFPVSMHCLSDVRNCFR